jgi:hypothetical protein
MTVGDSDDLDAVLTTNGWFAWIVACCPETRGGERRRGMRTRAAPASR